VRRPFAGSTPAWRRCVVGRNRVPWEESVTSNPNNSGREGMFESVAEGLGRRILSE
jgi:hypothetical protein